MNASALASSFLQEARTCYERGDLNRAEELCRRVLAVEANEHPALHLLGFVAQAGGRIEEGIDFLRLAVQANPSCADYHNNLGIMYCYAERLTEAAACF